MFKEGDTIYHSKILTFFRKESFALEATYAHPDKIPYPTPLIGESRTTCFVCSVHTYSSVYRNTVIYSNNFVYCTATVQLAMFRTDLDLRQAKLGLCTPKDETKLLTGCLNSAWLYMHIATVFSLEIYFNGCMQDNSILMKV